LFTSVESVINVTAFNSFYARFGVFMEMKFWVVVFTLKVKEAQCSEAFIFFHIPHGVIIEKKTTWNLF